MPQYIIGEGGTTAGIGHAEGQADFQIVQSRHLNAQGQVKLVRFHLGVVGGYSGGIEDTRKGSCIDGIWICPAWRGQGVFIRQGLEVQARPDVVAACRGAPEQIELALGLFDLGRIGDIPVLCACLSIKGCASCG